MAIIQIIVNTVIIVFPCPQAIYEKILSLDLQQVHAKIKQVDSHATLGNGIVIQVCIYPVDGAWITFPRPSGDWGAVDERPANAGLCTDVCAGPRVAQEVLCP